MTLAFNSVVIFSTLLVLLGVDLGNPLCLLPCWAVGFAKEDSEEDEGDI